MRLSNGIFLLYLLTMTSLSFAQEILSPLGTNTVLQQYVRDHPSNPTVSRIAAFNDTLILPFEDDFSRPGVYPFDSLWLDSNVYINTSFSANPKTIGIATFDGLNSKGIPYNYLANRDTVADFLTSRPIDLGQFAGDTSVWLSFFYQPQGLGDIPERDDSLVLQFKDTGGVWRNMLAIAGRSDTAFQRANVRVSDPIYQYKGFQFRFFNYATVNGNRDHWHLDYVILRRFTVANDSILDNSMLLPQKTLLTEYTSMPYRHYKALSNPAAQMLTQITDSIYNINYGGTSYLPQIRIENNGNALFSNNIGSISTFSSNTFTRYTIPLNNFTFPVIPGDSADFVYKSYFDFLGAQSNRHNDTAYCYQHFYNYYSYDDGSAEVAYSLAGNSDVSLAYQFDVKTLDTLRGVQIYFNPVGADVRNKLFQLTVWSSVDVAGNQSTQMYRLLNQKPGDPDGINGYKTYLFDTTLVVGPGSSVGSTIWVGFIQNEPATLYGVGLDKSIDSRGKMFYRLDGGWYQSSVKGSWMIRPVFGGVIPVVSVDELKKPALTFATGPNPAEQFTTLYFESAGSRKFTYRLTDLSGALIQDGPVVSGDRIELATVAAGIYFIRLSDPLSGRTGVQKLIVR